MSSSTQPPQPQPAPLSIAIIGGGIAGLALAIGLTHQKIPFTIYEAASVFSEIGAGVSLGPNAAQAMRLIDSRMYAGFRKCGTNNAWKANQGYWFSFRRGDGFEEGSDGGGEDGVGGSVYVDGEKLVGPRFLDLQCETGQTSVHRARFLDELVALVPEGVARFGKR